MVRDSLRDQESMVTVSLETSECGQGVSEDQDCIAPGVYRIRRLQSGGFTLGWGGLGCRGTRLELEIGWNQ